MQATSASGRRVRERHLMFKVVELLSLEQEQMGVILDFEILAELHAMLLLVLLVLQMV